MLDGIYLKKLLSKLLLPISTQYLTLPVKGVNSKITYKEQLIDNFLLYKLMKTVLLTLVSALLLLSGCTNNSQDNNSTNELKVLSWNVWHGGHSKAYPQKGCEGTLGILKKSDADIIMMIETYGCSDQVADHLGYYHRLLSSNLSIYSRYPIVKTYTFPDSISTFNFGGVELDVNGKRLRVFDTWLHYLPDATVVPTEKSADEIIAWENEGTRDDELKRILSVLKPFMAEADSIPLIMGGDFNCHSHLDWTEATKEQYNHNGKVIDWGISKMMLANNFKDSFREVHPNPETSQQELGATWYWDPEGKQKRFDRIDFIYYQGSRLKAILSESYNHSHGKDMEFKGEKFFYPSDHGFVLTTFSFE